MTHPPRGHPIQTREQQLAWARGVRSDMAGHSNARLRRACYIFLAEARAVDHADRAWAKLVLRVLPTGEKQEIDLPPDTSND